MQHSKRIIYTIGHSTRNIDGFIVMLQAFSIQVIVDIRSYPGSRRYPHFNKENLAGSLAKNNISYVHLPSLGGRRKPSIHSTNTGWKNDGFRGYADYMETEDFEQGIKELELTASNYTAAYMCSEALSWRCHRSLVSDYLKLNGWRVRHIMGKNKSVEHTYTSPAKIINGRLSYKSPQKNMEF